MSDAVYIGWWTPVSTMPIATGLHFHKCPECYEHVPCEMACSIEPELATDTSEYGAFCVCDDCERRDTTR